jgi:phenylacetate-CoA ligase
MSLEDRLYPLLSLYDRMPYGLKWSLGFAYRQLPVSWRRGKHYREFKRLAEEGEEWSREEIREFQMRELRRVLNHAHAYCPHYQKTFGRAGFRTDRFRDFEDLANCPMISKKDIIDHREEMCSTAHTKKDRLYITTGGSTGIPVGFYLHKGISRPKEGAFLEGIWKRGGYFDGARVCVLRGYVTSSRSEGKISSYDATRNWLMVSSYHLTADRLDLYLEEIERFKPEFMYVYPSAMLMLAEYLQARRYEWRMPMQGVLCGSEGMTLPQKRLLEQVFKCRVYAWYGHSERVVLAAQGRNSDAFYFVPQYGFAEFGPPNEEGLCEVIGTSFHNLVMPLIRYRTGDYVRLARPEEASEYPVPAALQIAGREHEFLVSGTGRKISLTAFNMHDAIFDGLYAVQFAQDKAGVAEFRFIPAAGFSEDRLRTIESGIRRKLGDDFEISFRQVAEVEKTSSGKHKWLVSKL